MTDPNENLPLGGGTPLGSPGMGFEADEKALHKGRGRMIAVMILAVLLGVGALALFMVTGQSDEQYAELGRSLNKLDRDYFVPFWGCAFQGAPRIGSNQDLEYEISKRAKNGGRRYGRAVRDRCMKMLTPMRTKLDTMLAPQEISAQVRSLSEQIEELQSGWSGFIGWLDAGEPWEDEDAAPHLHKIAKGWFDYQTERGAIGKAINKKLGRRVGTE